MRVKTIFALAIPAIIDHTLHMLLGVVDMFFVSKLGTNAVAAVGITNLIMNIYIAFFIAVGVGTTAIIARARGAGDVDKANHILKQSIIVAVFLGLLVGVPNLLFAKNIILLLGAEHEILVYALPYFLVVAVPSVFLCMMMVLSAALRGAGDTKNPMKVSLAVNIVNVVLDYILIFGILNFPGLGILGAGLATTIARIMGVLMLIKLLAKKESVLSIQILGGWSVDKTILRSLTRIGLPAGIERLIMRFGQLVYGGLIIKIGTEAFAAHNIAGTIESFSYLPGMGFGVAAAALVGQSLGSNKFLDARKFGVTSNVLATGFMVTMGLIFFVFAPGLAGLFTKDPEVVNLVVMVIRIAALFQPFLCITFVITAALQGAGDTRFPMYSTLIGIWGVRVVGTYLLGIIMGLGLLGVWISYVLDITIRGILLMYRFLKGNWKDIKI
ncbi:MATE family efflux transporter [Desulfitibacter alkalitolerans]|uniref:MATE family efflux transporter n=1 Tax=Desulfitibacter alkalitolerans TaxID=264641 RepID=UPI000688A92A|nr:MATE family efflux transporter [Desulfitibacter alkalitolerans]